MRLGFGLALDFSSANRSMWQLLEEYRGLLDLAEGLGFDSVWAGEDRQPTVAPGHVPSPFLVLASIAAQTDLHIGTGVTLLPLWNPIQLAYDVAMLDQISGGRFILGVGLGNPTAMRRYGIDPKEAPARMDEMLAALRHVWAGNDSYRGDTLFVEGPIRPSPIQPNGPPIWVGGSVRRSVERAVEFGEAWYGSTGSSLQLIAKQASRYQRRLEAVGRDPTQARVAVNRTAFVAADDEQAIRESEPFVRWVVDFYTSVGRIRSENVDPITGMPNDDLVFVGSPDTVASSLERYVDAGVTHFNLRVAMADMPIALALRTVRLLGTEVLPRFSL